MADRTVQQVLHALARMHARLRSFGLPVHRLHGDKAKELVSHQTHRWAADRQIVVTHTSGDSFKSNGRVEQEVGMLKRMVRILLKSQDWGENPLRLWPALARHGGERRLRTQLRKLGCPVPSLLPVGQRALARKVWQHRYEAWRDTREDVEIISVDANSSLTTPGYVVRSIDTGLWFTTGDVVVAHLPTVDQNPPIELEPHQERPSLLSNEEPRRRIHGKTAPPMLSHLVVGGVSAQDHGQGQLQGVVVEEQSQLHGRHVSAQGQLASLQPRGPEAQAEREGGGDRAHTHLQAEGRDAQTHRQAEGLHTKAHLCDGTSNQLQQLPEKSLQDQWQEFHGVVTDYIKEELELLDITDEMATASLPGLATMCVERFNAEQALRELQVQEDKDLQEEFLVTRTVGNQEVQSELDLWKPAIEKEWKSLTEETGAVRQITKQELRRLAEEKGQAVELLPSKMVFARKAGSGLRRARAVCCSNFQSQVEEGSTYAGGVDSVTVRMALRWAALQKWTVATLDVKTAFLNAPRTSPSIVATEVPQVMRQLGFGTGQEVWLIVGALYGLVTSPRDWQKCLDEQLPQMTWNQDREPCHLAPTNESNLWLVKKNRSTVGLMLVYVDDFLIVGEGETVHLAVQAIEAKWTCSKPTYVSESETVTFCGIEIRHHEESQGFELTQQAYEQELLERWPQQRSSPQIQLKVPQPDAEDEDDATIEEIREAQALTGALLWLSMHSMSTRVVISRPCHGKACGEEAKAYDCLAMDTALFDICNRNAVA